MLKLKIPSGRAHRWCKLSLTLGMLMMAVFVIMTPLASQTHEQDAVEIRPLTRVEPDYPETLKRLYIGGVVRVGALVAPNGVVESTELLGGNPILGQSAMKAVKQWKLPSA